MASPADIMSPRLCRALRLAATAHRTQARKGSGVPYVEHVVAVAWIVDRLGFDEDTVIGGLLHDAVEDTEVTLREIDAQFGPAVARIVAECSEVKHDAFGNKRPWIDRKRDHLAALTDATAPTRAVMLADKLHNLLSIELDLGEGRPVWSQFNAERTLVLWYYRAVVDQLGAGDPRLEALAAQCRAVLSRIEAIGPNDPAPRPAERP